MTTFDARENSNYTGEPVTLYEFRRGSAVLSYASSDQDIVAGGRTYVATPMSDGGINQKGTAVTDVFEITCPIILPLIDWFAATAPSDTIYVTVRRFHFGDTQAIVAWLGQVVAVALNPDETAKVSAQAVSVSLKRTGLRLTWQRGCPHAIYDQNCQVPKESYRVDATINEVFVERFEVDPGAINNGQFWPGGIIEWDVEGGYTERRLIESVDAPNGRIYPFGFLDGFVTGMTIRLYPGCKRVTTWCDGFFRNIENYGGFSWMPNRSPYDGDPVF